MVSRPMQNVLMKELKQDKGNEAPLYRLSTINCSDNDVR